MHNIIYITFADKEQANAAAKRLLAEGLIACANIMPPHTAIYEWEGKLAEEQEVLLLAKSGKDKFAEIETTVKELHTYDTPCIISVDIKGANAEFLNWVDESLNK